MVEHPKSKSTEGFYRPDRSPCTLLIVVVALSDEPLNMALGAIAVVLLIVVEQKNSFKKSNSYVSRKIASIRNKALYVHEFALGPKLFQE